MDFTVTGSADLARLARWGMDEGELPQGQVTFRATAVGPMGNPDATVDVASQQLSWRGVIASDLSARARVTSERADVEALGFRFSNGMVTGAAAIPFEAGAGATVTAAWMGIDAALAAKTLAPDAEVLPSAVAAGRVDLQGVLADLSTWSGDLRLQLAPGRNARGRLPVGGNLALNLHDGRWRLEGQPRIAGAVPARLVVQGPLGGTEGPPVGISQEHCR